MFGRILARQDVASAVLTSAATGARGFYVHPWCNDQNDRGLGQDLDTANRCGLIGNFRGWFSEESDIVACHASRVMRLPSQEAS